MISDFKVFSTNTPKSFSEGASSPPSFGRSGTCGFGGSPLKDQASWSQTHFQEQVLDNSDDEDETDEGMDGLSKKPENQVPDADADASGQAQGAEQGIGVKQGSISFDQARRITTSAAWRTIRT